MAPPLLLRTSSEDVARFRAMLWSGDSDESVRKRAAVRMGWIDHFGERGADYGAPLASGTTPTLLSRCSSFRRCQVSDLYFYPPLRRCTPLFPLNRFLEAPSLQEISQAPPLRSCLLSSRGFSHVRTRNKKMKGGRQPSQGWGRGGGCLESPET
jgi:hypothetical protein